MPSTLILNGNVYQAVQNEAVAPPLPPPPCPPPAGRVSRVSELQLVKDRLASTFFKFSK